MTVDLDGNEGEEILDVLLEVGYHDQPGMQEDVRKRFSGNRQKGKDGKPAVECGFRQVAAIDNQRNQGEETACQT